MILRPGRGSLLALGGVLCLGFVKCVIWIWIGRVSFVEKLNFQAGLALNIVWLFKNDCSCPLLCSVFDFERVRCLFDFEHVRCFVHF